MLTAWNNSISSLFELFVLTTAARYRISMPSLLRIFSIGNVTRSLRSWMMSFVFRRKALASIGPVVSEFVKHFNAICKRKLKKSTFATFVFVCAFICATVKMKMPAIAQPMILFISSVWFAAGSRFVADTKPVHAAFVLLSVHFLRGELAPVLTPCVEHEQ